MEMGEVDELPEGAGDVPDLVAIEWDSYGPTSVAVSGEWQAKRDHAGLLDQIFRLAMDHFAGAGRPSWRANLSIANVPLSRLREFNALLQEARAEDRQVPRLISSEIASEHCRSTWVDGRLTGLDADESWLADASVMGISSEFVHVLTPPPPAESDVPTAARNRFERFMQEYR